LLTIFAIIEVIQETGGDLVDFSIEAGVSLAEGVENEAYIVADGAIETIFYSVLRSEFDDYIPI
jgi:hypothetical protein